MQSVATICQGLSKLPNTCRELALFGCYNKDLLGKAGLLNSNGLPNLDGVANFTTGLRKLKDNGAEYRASLATADGGTVWRLWYSMLNQINGAQFISGKSVCPADNCANVTAQITS